MAVALGLVALFATSELTYAQNIYKEQQKQQKRIEKSQRKYERQQQQQRYRVYTNGNYYDTDDRGYQMLQQAVNSGYQQGFRAGQYDAQRRYQYGYNSQNMYRTGTYGYQSYVDRNQYRYYFQQGFQRGYQDGYYRRNQYGNNGTNILGSILSTILNIQRNN